VKPLTFVVAALVALALSSSALWAKGATRKIVMTGRSLGAPIEIVDATTLEAFNVWSGPGTFIRRGGQTSEAFDGFIVDWRSGPVEPPNLPRYEVRFFVESSNDGHSPPYVAYIVTYALDRVSHHGYVHLPGRDDEWYAVNTRSIFRGHGLEGQWLKASRTWDSVAEPLIAAAE